MNPIFAPVIGGIIEAVGKIADDLITSDEERAQMALEGVKIEAELVKGKLSINEAEARHSSLFVAGWRPAIGWIGAGAMGYQFILYPFMVWIWTLAQSRAWIPASLEAPPMLDTDALWVILSGMLGIAGLRSAEKIKSVTQAKAK